MAVAEPIMGQSYEECVEELQQSGYHISTPAGGRKYCPATWDGILCWPAIRVSTRISFYCPDLRGLDTAKTVTRLCESDGNWTGSNADTWKLGRTDFSGCKAHFTSTVPTPVRNFGSEPDSDPMHAVELTGHAISMTACFLVIVCFACFRRFHTLRNQCQLQAILASFFYHGIRGILRVDDYYLYHRRSNGEHSLGNSITSTEYACEALYILHEYFYLVMLFWIAADGLRTYSLIGKAKDSLHSKTYIIHIAFTWILGLLPLIVWILTLANNSAEIPKCLGNYRPSLNYAPMIGTHIIVHMTNLIIVFISPIKLCLLQKPRSTCDLAHHRHHLRSMRKNFTTMFLILLILLADQTLRMLAGVPVSMEESVWTVPVSRLVRWFPTFLGFFISFIYFVFSMCCYRTERTQKPRIGSRNPIDGIRIRKSH